MSVTQPVPMPNTFLAGAPKCGTTSLANWLSEHPDIFLPAKKEPHFFNPEFSRSMSEEIYKQLYSTSGTFAVRLDASTSYFTSEFAISQICQLVPDAKFIVMLRNPIEVARGLHSECLYRGLEDTECFERAWNKQDVRRQGQQIPVGARFASVKNLMYKEQVMFGAALERLISRVGTGRVHIIFTEELRLNPKECYEKTLGFLGLPSDDRNFFPTLNRAKRNRYARLTRIARLLTNLKSRLGLPRMGLMSALLRAGHEDAERPPISASLEQKIFEDLKADIALLQELTGRDLSHWAPSL